MKAKGYFIKIFLIISAVSLSVMSTYALKDTKENREPTRLFKICNALNEEECYTIDEDSIGMNMNYNDLFEIKDGEIYLDNANITLDIRNKQKFYYTIHITGTNKITELNNINERIRNGLGILKNNYLAFNVEGEGSLEIIKTNIIKNNLDDEKYYKCWKYNAPYEMEFSEEDYSKCLKHCVWDSDERWSNPLTGEVEDYSIYNCSIPDEGFTLSDLANYEYDGALGLYFLLADQEQISLCSNCEEDALTNSEYPFRYLNIFDLMQLNNYDYDFDFRLYKNDLSGPSYRRTLFNRVVGDGIIVPTNLSTEKVQLTRDWADEYIKTDLPKTFTDTGSYLIGTKQEEPVGNLEEITTTQAGNIVFTSTEAFDSNYHLGVNDITESITDVDASKVEAKTDKTLIKLYDINMLDKDNKVVDMGNGTYTIKVALSDLLKKYNEYQVVYINENGVELIPASVEDNYIVFNTTHLSKYGIVGLEKTTKKDIITGEDITNPKTADTIVTLILLFISLAFASALVLYRIKKIKRLD